MDEDVVIWDEFEEDEEDERGQVHREQQPDEEAEITAPAFLVQDNDSALLKEVKEPQKGGGGEDEAATATSTTSAKQEAPEFSINSAAATTNIPKNQEETEEKDAQQLSVDGPKSLLISELTWWTSDRDIELACQMAGSRAELNVVDIAFQSFKSSGKSRGTVVVPFASHSAAEKTKLFLESKQIWGKQTRVSLYSGTTFPPSIRPPQNFYGSSGHLIHHAIMQHQQPSLPFFVPPLLDPLHQLQRIPSPQQQSQQLQNPRHQLHQRSTNANSTSSSSSRISSPHARSERDYSQRDRSALSRERDRPNNDEDRHHRLATEDTQRYHSDDLKRRSNVEEQDQSLKSKDRDAPIKSTNDSNIFPSMEKSSSNSSNIKINHNGTSINERDGVEMRHGDSGKRRRSDDQEDEEKKGDTKSDRNLKHSSSSSKDKSSSRNGSSGKKSSRRDSSRERSSKKSKSKDRDGRRRSRSRSRERRKDRR